jgi:hypothetical protein
MSPFNRSLTGRVVLSSTEARRYPPLPRVKRVVKEAKRLVKKGRTQRSIPHTGQTHSGTTLPSIGLESLQGGRREIEKWSNVPGVVKCTPWSNAHTGQMHILVKHTRAHRARTGVRRSERDRKVVERGRARSNALSSQMRILVKCAYWSNSLGHDAQERGADALEGLGVVVPHHVHLLRLHLLSCTYYE